MATGTTAMRQPFVVVLPWHALPVVQVTRADLESARVVWDRGVPPSPNHAWITYLSTTEAKGP